MILNPAIKIKTERLTLQPVEDSYIDNILEHFTNEVTRYMPFNPQGNRKDIISFVNESKRTLLQNTDLVMVALDSNRDFIGCCGIHNITEESIELGLWLKKNSQGKGLGTEIIAALIEFLENNFTFKYILYPVDEENIASRKIPEKLGFIQVKKYTKYKSPSINLTILEYRKYYQNEELAPNKKP
ncbi:GNAT family N-acetyltransferase [Chryseobacterium jejuense]|uniref:Protein N-acetyltransferase, RimJ/RimL family n=1 Tax=Chryseobacterium jejuense TaxID=445960 RepID=A0A2X2WZK2_CHRJE|nr:GNAT family N-acetyltransferase [Chryseobacterium jejuense]SDJ83705.1 Protein N-acetyltransferase, RimJ/RimL family [Chryseobacterium jejuense]SQB43691.1 ribosomal-protein-alanine acetyltransferase [Chryseobacterium jejuense]